MDIEPFELERWQSLWEHRVEVNIAESGVHPLTLEELVDDVDAMDELLSERLIYTQTNGTEALRERIAALYPDARASNVLVTNGCAEANFLLAWGLLEPGDRVVFQQPNYLQLGGLARGFGADVRPWWLRAEAGWEPDPDDLKTLVTDRTRLVAVCNPNNPTGALLPEAAVAAAIAESERVGAWVLADEVYRGAELEERITPTLWGRGERVVCTGGLSKAYGLPGLRVGWIVAPEPLIERLWSHRDYTTICCSALGDRLATHALQPERRRRILARTRGILRENYPIVADWIRGFSGRLEHRAPEAGAIAWVGDRERTDTKALARRALEEKGLLLVPGEQFGVGSHLRLGIGGDPAELRTALDRLGELL